MDTFKKSHQLIKAVILSALLSGCANVDQFLNQGERAEQLTVKIEQQSEQIALLVEQQNTILATLSQQPEFFAQQKQNIAELNTKLEDYVQLRQQVDNNSKNIAIYEAQNKLDESKHGLVIAQSSEAITPLDKRVIGSEELVLLDDLTEKFKARIDTGATTSSLNATDIVEFERDGTKWVRFNFNKNLTDSQIIEAKVARTILIRQANSTEPTRRPIIELPIQLGDIKTLTEFTLADRSHMSFPVLLGRTFLKDIVMVDVARTYTSSESITQ